MMAASKWTRIRRSPGKFSLTYAAVLRVWYDGSFQLNEDKEVPGKLFSLKQPAQVRANQEKIDHVSNSLCYGYETFCC